MYNVATGYRGNQIQPNRIQAMFYKNVVKISLKSVCEPISSKGSYMFIYSKFIEADPKFFFALDIQCDIY